MGSRMSQDLTNASDRQSAERGDCPQRADGSVSATDWEVLTGQVAACYRLRVDAADPRGKPRYIAVARSLAIRPYAVVTSDPAELLTALGCDPTPVAAHGQESRR